MFRGCFSVTGGSPSAVVSPCETDMCTAVLCVYLSALPHRKHQDLVPRTDTILQLMGVRISSRRLDFQVNYWNQADDVEGLGQRGKGFSYMSVSKKGYVHALILFLHDSRSDLMVKFCPSLPITVH